MIDKIKSIIHSDDYGDYSKRLFSNVTYIITASDEHYHELYDIFYYIRGELNIPVKYISLMREGHVAFNLNATDCPSGVVVNFDERYMEKFEKYIVTQILSGKHVSLDKINCAEIERQKIQCQQEHFESLFEVA